METKQPTILLIEDQNSTGSAIVESLATAELGVKWVRTIREARTEIEQQPWDLAILDHTLETEGLEFFQALRFAPHCPAGGVIMLIDAQDIRSKERAHQLGAAGVIVKPDQLDQVVGMATGLLAYI